MDIHANWKWGSILPKRRLKEECNTSENKEITDDDVLMKFPLKDPRTSKSWRFKKKKVKSVEANGDDKKEIESIEIPALEDNDKAEKEKEQTKEIRDFEITNAKQQESVDTTKETSDKDKKDSES